MPRVCCPCCGEAFNAPAADGHDSDEPELEEKPAQGFVVIDTLAGKRKQQRLRTLGPLAEAHLPLVEFDETARDRLPILAELVRDTKSYCMGLAIAEELDHQYLNWENWTARDNEIYFAHRESNELGYYCDWSDTHLMDHTKIYETQIAGQYDKKLHDFKYQGVSMLIGNATDAIRCGDIICGDFPVNLVESMNSEDVHEFDGSLPDWKSHIESQGNIINLRYRGVDYTGLRPGSWPWLWTLKHFTDICIWKEAVPAVLAKIQELMNSAKGNCVVVLIHCYGGINRSVAFAMVLIQAIEFYSLKKKISVLDMIKMTLGKHRRGVGPWRGRSYFLYALLAFETHTFESGTDLDALNDARVEYE